MEVFWITFRIKSDSTYDDRYTALVNAVHVHAVEGWWSEPTSFWLVGSNSSRAQIAASIKAAIAPSKDLALIGSMAHTGATLIGKADDLATLKLLEPKLVTA
jgi:hypothetical protein